MTAVAKKLFHGDRCNAQNTCLGGSVTGRTEMQELLRAESTYDVVLPKKNHPSILVTHFEGNQNTVLNTAI